MTQRERKLTMIVGGLFGAFLVWMVVQKLVVTRISDLRAEVASKQVELGRLQQQAWMESRLHADYIDLKRHTLGDDPDRVRNALDRLMKTLLEQAGITEHSAAPGTPQYERATRLWKVPYTIINAKADMQSFVRFLHGFYQQPYAMKITGGNVLPTSRGAGQLILSGLTVEALLLGDDPKLDEPVVPPALASQPVDPWRQIEPDLNAYAMLWTRKFMEPYSPPAPVPPAPPPPPVTPPGFSPNGGPFNGPMRVTLASATAGAKIRYTTDGTTPTPTTGIEYSGPFLLEEPATVRAVAYTEDGKISAVAAATFQEPPPPPLKLVGLVTYGPTAEAVLINTQTQERQVVKEGSSFDKGTLLVVLPEAAVGEQPDGERYVYWLGSPLQQRERLDPVQHPNIAAAVELLMESP